MIDIQSSKDSRCVPIRWVGVTDIRHPLLWKESSEESPNESLPTTGCFALLVALPAEEKGTHMSRFLQCLYDALPHLDASSLEALVKKVKSRLEAPKAKIELKFPYFFEKEAPVSKTKGVAEADITLSCMIDENDSVHWEQTVEVKATSLCPCSKAISKYGAHNQRSLLLTKIMGKLQSLDSIIESAEKSASCALYPTLKSEDEKYVTEKAYENPRFVEDLVREMAVNLAEKGLRHFEVSSVNYESIHNHNVWAVVKSEDFL